MTGKSGRTVVSTAEEIAARREGGEARSRRLDREEALRRRRADPEAPAPDPGWETTIVPGVPERKRPVTIRLDADVVDWFQNQGKGYQTRINAVLRAYVDAHRS